LSGPVEVIINVFRPQKRGDLDNILKATLDSFNGLLYDDDSQIVKIIAMRSDDKLNPRVEVTINALG
jgi:Holliday junction resolvase RusA-like endonuclease